MAAAERRLLELGQDRGAGLPRMLVMAGDIIDIDAVTGAASALVCWLDLVHFDLEPTL